MDAAGLVQPLNLHGITILTPPPHVTRGQRPWGLDRMQALVTDEAPPAALSRALHRARVKVVAPNLTRRSPVTVVGRFGRPLTAAAANAPG